MLNGVTELVMTKADVLSGFDEISICTHYIHDGEKIDYMPYDIISIPPQPLIKNMPGWKKDITGITKPDEIPEALRSEEHTSELQSLMRISYDALCLKKTKYNIHT